MRAQRHVYEAGTIDWERCGAYLPDVASGLAQVRHAATQRMTREAGNSTCGVPVRVLSARGEQLAMQAAEGRGCAIVGAQPENQLATVLDETARAVDEFLHHRLQAPALGRVAHRCVRPVQAGLAH